jgi:sugar phosphate permease
VYVLPVVTRHIVGKPTYLYKKKKKWHPRKHCVGLLRWWRTEKLTVIKKSTNRHTMADKAESRNSFLFILIWNLRDQSILLLYMACIFYKNNIIRMGIDGWKKIYYKSRYPCLLLYININGNGQLVPCFQFLHTWCGL